MDDDKKYRISSLSGIFLISTSLTLDAVQALLNLFGIGVIINRIITPFAWMGFFTWFNQLGIKFSKGAGKNLGTSITGFIIEMIPLLDLLPGWTVATLMLIRRSRQEDKAKFKKDKLSALKKLKNKAIGRTAQTTAKPAAPSMRGEVVAPARSAKMEQAGKELTAAQTTGSKTAEEKMAEESPLAKTRGTEQRKETEKKQEAKPEPGETDGGEMKQDDPNDTRTDRYKKQQAAQRGTGDGGEYEGLAMKEEAPQSKNNQKAKIVTMHHDPYREPVEISKKTASPHNNDSMKMAA